MEEEKNYNKPSYNLLAFFSLSIFLIVIFLNVSSFPGFTKRFNISDKRVIKDFTITQLPAVSGQPVKWVKTVSLNNITKTEHLLAVPKGASQIKISLSSDKLGIPSTKSDFDRSELVKISLENSQSGASQAIAK